MQDSMSGHSTPGPHARATLTSLPQEVLEVIVNRLHSNEKRQLALCCKATLPILCMGHVRVRAVKEHLERHLLNATRCLTKQPGGISHFELWSWDIHYKGTVLIGIHHLADLSLLFNLRKLTLHTVAVSLPALQPVATRLCELNVSSSRLLGSADGFLTKGWTALTSLSLTLTKMEDATLTAALELPALEDVHIDWLTGHQGGELHFDQLTGSCPQVSRLEFRLGNCLRHPSEASRQSCRLLRLKRLADLKIISGFVQTHVDLDLPPSLTQLRFQGDPGVHGSSFDFIWALQQAVKCIGRGAQLHRLICSCADDYEEPVQWCASLDKQHRLLGGQLCGLRELEVWGGQEQLPSAVGAVASAAPSLVSLRVVITDPLHCVEVSSICSASLENIRVERDRYLRLGLPPPQVLLTFMPGCTRLREVAVQFKGRPLGGAAVKIRSHCCSRRCIVPGDGYTRSYSALPVQDYDITVNGMVVEYLRAASSEQDVEECTVLYACRAAGLEQTPSWGHAVMPGIL